MGKQEQGVDTSVFLAYLSNIACQSAIVTIVLA